MPPPTHTPTDWVVESQGATPSTAAALDRMEQAILGALSAAAKSAYDLAVENGFTGTVSEWLASLEGDAGPAGPSGPSGPAGPEGTPPNPVTFTQYVPSDTWVFANPRPYSKPDVDVYIDGEIVSAGITHAADGSSFTIHFFPGLGVVGQVVVR